MKLKLKIIHLDGIYFEGEVDLLNIKLASGEVTILHDHQPLISAIQISHMYYKNDGEEVDFAIAGGTLFVNEAECKVITSAIEKANDIDFARAEEAKQRAMDRLNKHSEGIDVARAEIALKRALNRLSYR